jgi:hypothetical protein
MKVLPPNVTNKMTQQVSRNSPQFQRFRFFGWLMFWYSDRSKRTYSPTSLSEHISDFIL